MEIEKPVTPTGSSVNWILHYTFQEWITETKNEINISLMNSLAVNEVNA